MRTRDEQGLKHVSLNGESRERVCVRRAGRGSTYTRAPGYGGEGPSGRPARVGLRGKICAMCSGTVTTGDRALLLPCPGDGHVLHSCCALNYIKRPPVGAPFHCSAEACGARNNHNIIHIDAARPDLKVLDRVYFLGAHPLSNDSA